MGSSLVGCKLEARYMQVENILVILIPINTISKELVWGKIYNSIDQSKAIYIT